MSTTIGNQLTSFLRDAIISGEIEQGSKLSETKLAKSMDVSRGPLREAIRRLEGMRLVQTVPQKGSRVVKLNTELVLQMYHTREALEAKSAALASQNMTSQEIEQLYRLIDTQSNQLKESSSASVSAESDYAFHEKIIKGSKNKVIQQVLLDEMYYLIKMFRYQSEAMQKSGTNTLTEHRQIAYAIEQRDALLAETTMRQHIARARERVQQRSLS